MKKILIIVVFILGCEINKSDTVVFERHNNNIKLKIRHCLQEYTINTMEEANFHKDKLQKLVREIENFEHELSLMEK